MKNAKFYLLLTLISLVSITAFTDDDPPVNENPVKVQVRLEPAKISKGGQANLHIDMTVDKDFHAYKDMLKVQWMSDEGVTVDNMQVTPIHEFKDRFSGKTREVVEDQATVTSIMHVPVSSELGGHLGKVNFTYQACSSQNCLFPKTISLEVPYTVAAAIVGDSNNGSSTGSAAAAGAGAHSKTDFEKQLDKGMAWAFLWVFLAGFLTSLTPCVFPMIPITISIIGARSATNKRSRSFALSFSYVLGIGITYASLGVLAATTGAFFGAALSNPYVVTGIALTFAIMALSMMGLFEIQVPLALRNRFGNANTGTGLPGAFLAGLFAGLVASPCIGPVLVGILAYVAQTARPVFGFFLLFSFAMGMGILFMVLGTFSGLLTKMPKAGGWMETIKLVFGVTFMAMAFYYIHPIASKTVFNGLLAMALIFMASYLGAFAPVTTQKEQLHKGIWQALFFAGVTLMATVIIQHSGMVIGGAGNTGSSETAAAKPGLKWQPYSEALLKQAKADHKPVIVDFSADWCAACHELEELTFTDSRVRELADQFVLLNVDATTATDAVNALQKQYGIIGLPTIVFIDRSGERVHEGRLPGSTDVKEPTINGFVPADEFVKHMKLAL